MKTTILLIRHGETDWNKDVRFQGQTNIPLCENGINQAHLAKERLKNSFDVIYTSPLDRAYETARIISEGNNLTPIIYDNLIEINFGPWEGLTMSDVKEQYPDDLHSWKTDKEFGYFTGGEKSIKEVSLRAKNAILDITNQNRGKRIGIVAHGGLLKAALVGLFDMDMTMYHKVFLNNTSVTTITMDNNGNLMLLGLNDYSHLAK